MEGGSVNRPIGVRSPIDVDRTANITDPTRGAASTLGGKKLSPIEMDRAVMD